MAIAMLALPVTFYGKINSQNVHDLDHKNGPMSNVNIPIERVYSSSYLMVIVRMAQQCSVIYEILLSGLLISYNTINTYTRSKWTQRGTHGHSEKERLRVPVGRDEINRFCKGRFS